MTENRIIVFIVGRATLDNRSLSTAEIPTKDDKVGEEEEEDDDPASILPNTSLPQSSSP